MRIMSRNIVFVGAVVCWLVTAAGATAAQDSPSRAVTITNPSGAPARIDTATLVESDGNWTLSIQVTNASESSIVRVETTIAIFDSEGRRRGAQVDAFPDAILPIEPGQARRMTVPVTSAVEETDTVRVGLSTIGSDVDIWTNDGLTTDPTSKPAEAPTPTPRSTAAASSVIVLNAEDSPAEVMDAILVRSATGAPAVLHITTHNRLTGPLFKVRVAALLFDSKGGLQLQSFGVDARPIAPLGNWMSNIIVNHVRADSHWRVVIAIEQAYTITNKWTNAHLRERATERIRQDE